MLHMIHLLERRHGNHRAHRIAMRLLLASMLLLMLGLGLLLPGRAAAQDATPVDGAACSTTSMQAAMRMPRRCSVRRWPRQCLRTS